MDIITNNKIKDNTNKSIYLSVVMPAYNEEKNITDNLLKASEIISNFVKNYEIIAVNDGSSDNTEAMIKKACEKDNKIYGISYSDNQGKGYAITTGVKKATGQYIAFLDSDLELNPSMLRYFLKALQANDADIAIGSKMHKKSKLDYPVSRKILSLGYYIILKVLFKLNIKDTQTGIKLFKGTVIKPICETLTTTGFAFDIEILATASKKGYKIIEMPIELKFLRERSEKSRFSPKIILKIFKDTISIKKALKTK